MKRRWIIPVSLLFLVLTSCGSSMPAPEVTVPEAVPAAAEITLSPTDPPTEPPTAAPTRTEKLLSGMSLHEKVCQLFIVTPECLTGYDVLTYTDEWFTECCGSYPVGGFIFFDKNIEDGEQTAAMVKNAQKIMQKQGVGAFMSVDEEGGDVTRLQYPLGLREIDQMYVYGESGDTQAMREDAEYIGSYLSDYGFSLDFAPVADVEINPYNELQTRIFSNDPQVVAELSSAYISGLHSEGVCTALKHFPGLGAGDGNTHYDTVVIDRTLDELRGTEFPAFLGGIHAGTDFVMVGHQITTGSGDGLPGDLSEVVVTEWLRKELGYGGLIITDSHSMGAIINHYSSADAALMAIEAGVDMVLMPYDLTDAVTGVESAVLSGRIDESRIDRSVQKILDTKESHGIL